MLLRGAETHTRSILKAVSWRTTKVAWYYVHERVWSAIPWGRRH